MSYPERLTIVTPAFVVTPPSSRSATDQSLPIDMSKALMVSYDLKPPTNTAIPDAYPSSKTHGIPVNVAAGSQSHSEFCTTLREAIAQAKAQIGEALTVWRDAVGALENAKEPKRAQNEEDEDEDEDEDEGEDEACPARPTLAVPEKRQLLFNQNYLRPKNRPGLRRVAV